MQDRDERTADRLWATFEAEAMPHVDRLFRLARWFERDRDQQDRTCRRNKVVLKKRPFTADAA